MCLCKGKSSKNDKHHHQSNNELYEKTGGGKGVQRKKKNLKHVCMLQKRLAFLVGGYFVAVIVEETKTLETPLSLIHDHINLEELPI